MLNSWPLGFFVLFFLVSFYNCFIFPNDILRWLFISQMNSIVRRNYNIKFQSRVFIEKSIQPIINKDTEVLLLIKQRESVTNMFFL